ncbi:MAG: thymidylate synthase [bacterium]
MRVIQGENFANLYKNICYELMTNPEYETAPRGQKIKEISDAILINQDPTSNLFLNPERDVPLKYLAGELLWYFSGRNDVNFISKFSSFWENICNENGTCNSAYGNLIFNKTDTRDKITQFQWAYDSLVKDKDSRQAIIHFNRPEHQYKANKDFVCTLIGNFQIRNNKLNFTIDMRSNDIFFGLTFDYPFFTILQQQMFNHLKKIYPELEIGTYTHIAHSLHIYERNFEQIEKMMQNEFEPHKTPELTVDFVDEKGNPTFDILKIVSMIEDENNTSFYSDHHILRWLYGYATNK